MSGCGLAYRADFLDQCMTSFKIPFSLLSAFLAVDRASRRLHYPQQIVDERVALSVCASVEFSAGTEGPKVKTQKRCWPAGAAHVIIKIMTRSHGICCVGDNMSGCQPQEIAPQGVEKPQYEALQRLSGSAALLAQLFLYPHYSVQSAGHSFR